MDKPFTNFFLIAFFLIVGPCCQASAEDEELVAPWEAFKNRHIPYSYEEGRQEAMTAGIFDAKFVFSASPSFEDKARRTFEEHLWDPNKIDPEKLQLVRPVLEAAFSKCKADDLVWDFLAVEALDNSRSPQEALPALILLTQVRGLDHFLPFYEKCCELIDRASLSQHIRQLNIY
jgi:hypothetical protein